MASYDVGAPVRVSVTFYNILNQPTDPTNVTFRYRPPGQNPVVVSTPDIRIVRDGVGQYHFDIDTTGWTAGSVPYRWEGSGLLIAAVDNAFTLNASTFYPS